MPENEQSFVSPLSPKESKIHRMLQQDIGVDILRSKVLIEQTG